MSLRNWYHRVGLGDDHYGECQRQHVVRAGYRRMDHSIFPLHCIDHVTQHEWQWTCSEHENPAEFGWLAGMFQEKQPSHFTECHANDLVIWDDPPEGQL